MDIRLPNLGEGADSGTVVTILVRVGDKVAKDQTIVELENEKAVAPIPSPEQGVVDKIYVKIGDKIIVGQPILSLAGGPAQPSAAEKKVSSEGGRVRATPDDETLKYHSGSPIPPAASPTVRLIAEELGLDLTRIKGSAPGGRILVSDLKAYIDVLKHRAQSDLKPVDSPEKQRPEKIDFSKWGPIRREPLTPIRRTIGQRMMEAWTTIPHVTQHEEADVTLLFIRRKQMLADYQKKGVHLTVTAFLVKFIVEALKKYPAFNASLDADSSEAIYKDYYHIGIAVDTESGLVVPVIKEADKKNLLEISAELEALAEKARQRKLTPEELKGGTFTITNVGGIGGSFFTPIINKPQSAILGIGKAVERPIISEGRTKNRWTMPLSLSYDHRLIDGADGARFMKEIVTKLERVEI